jgi:hypothetical protein
MEWNLRVVLFGISFIGEDAEHLFMYFLRICTSSEDCLFSSFVHPWIRLFPLLVFNFWSSLYTLHSNTLSNE